MITVKILKQLLNGIPDDFEIELDDNRVITDYLVYHKSIDNVDKNIFKFISCNLHSKIASILDYSNRNGKTMSLYELIKMFEDNNFESVENFLRIDIDSYISNMVSCKLQDNFSELKSALKELQKTDSEGLERLVRVTDLTTILKKIL